MTDTVADIMQPRVALHFLLETTSLAVLNERGFDKKLAGGGVGCVGCVPSLFVGITRQIPKRYQPSQETSQTIIGVNKRSLKWILMVT